MASEVSVHGPSAPLGLCEALQHGASSWWRKAAHLVVARKQRKKWKGLGSRCPLQGQAPRAYFLQLGPTSEPSTQELLWDTEDQTMTGGKHGVAKTTNTWVWLK